MERVEIDLALKVVLTKEDIQDLVTTALCGGIGYWAKLDNSGAEFDEAPKDECIDETVARLMMEGKAVKLIELEEGTVWEWTIEKLTDGVKRFLENGGGGCKLEFKHGVIRFDMTYVDADIADMIVQYGIFGELVYA